MVDVNFSRNVYIKLFRQDLSKAVINHLINYGFKKEQIINAHNNKKQIGDYLAYHHAHDPDFITLCEIIGITYEDGEMLNIQQVEKIQFQKNPLDNAGIS